MTNERITLDLTGTDDATQAGGDFEALPKGWYRGFVYEAEQRETGERSKNPGSPYYRLRLNVTGTPKDDSYDGRVVFDNFVGLYVTEAAPFLAQKAEQLARITGVWDGQDRSEVAFPTVDELEGTEVEFLVKKERNNYAEERAIEEYEDETGESPDERPVIWQNTVTAYRPVGGWPKPGEEPVKKASKTNITL